MIFNAARHEQVHLCKLQTYLGARDVNLPENHSAVQLRHQSVNSHCLSQAQGYIFDSHKIDVR